MVARMNEPATSSLMGPLARLIVRAGERSQLVVTTHSHALAGAPEAASGERAIVLARRSGATVDVSLGAGSLQ